MRRFNKIFTVVVLLFLYIPMIVLAVGSFNSGMDIAVFKDFTLDNYRELFSDGVLLPLLLNSVIVAVIASVIATVLGTAAAIGINSMSPKLRKLSMSITNIPMTNPEIVTGVSLALLFAFVGTLLKINNILGFATLLIAHVTFCLPYVILSVMPKLHQMDPNLNEAAQDLGCTPVQAFFKVVIHEITPGIISGALMSFTMSLDDFVISYRLRTQVRDAARRDLQLHQKAPAPQNLRTFHPPVCGHSDRYGRYEPAAGEGRKACP